MFLLIFCLTYNVESFASRAYAPEKIQPVIYKDLKIVAENSSPDNMGIIQAFNVNTNTIIWSKKVYKVKINPHVEDDTQWIFIKKMKIQNDKLIVINEKDKEYTLDANTGKVLDGNSSIIIIVIAIPVIISLAIVLINKKKNCI